ncbi:peptide-methionine (S)-S-oxide reductase MsrA [Pareuzebyella sediminis]|uniref:peptide-methionine (S)-S-oxide reductase MsrA n=1 Tax=Pareuzebyella sediminis TaxID=2607998 RepID=UPI0011EED7CF|nr:peptide-methionine (S)-S-oxide reductase MsrA [Pareuzebyella sediminis]
MPIEKLATLTVGGGCFWCLEAIFQQIDGVEKVVAGYCGVTCPGHPTYREVCSGKTGHAEVVQVTYDPRGATYADLLKIFMSSHNPTLTNVERFSYGSQYRSVIFYHDEQEKVMGETILRTLQPHFKETIGTELRPIEPFYAAEEYHQNYYDKNRKAPFCEAIIDPKLSKLRKIYPKLGSNPIF